jgi:hypothetical protein
MMVSYIPNTILQPPLLRLELLPLHNTSSKKEVALLTNDDDDVIYNKYNPSTH